MSLLARVLGTERRAALNAPPQWLTDALAGGASYSGRAVTVESSMRLVPVYAATRLLAGAVGSLPLMVYRRTGEGRERASNNWMWPLLHDQPNTVMAADELWELVTAHLLLWGNAFIGKIKNHPVYPVGELYPIRPDRVQVDVDKDTGDRTFLLDGSSRHTDAEIIHIRFLGTDGVVGLSPIQQARQMLGTVADMEEFSGRFYGNNAWVSGTLTHPNHLSEDAGKRLKDSWRAAHGGVGKAGQTAILEEGMKYEGHTMPLEDAQFIETAQFNNLQVALLMGVPPKLLGAKAGDSLTYTSSEWEGLDFVRWSLRRILVRIEGSLRRDPDLFPQRQKFYPEFLTEALMRGTTKERFEAYQLALDPDKGWMERAEVRELENLPAEQELVPDKAPVVPAPDLIMNGGASA